MMKAFHFGSVGLPYGMGCYLKGLVRLFLLEYPRSEAKMNWILSFLLGVPEETCLLEGTILLEWWKGYLPYDPPYLTEVYYEPYPAGYILPKWNLKDGMGDP